MAVRGGGGGVEWSGVSGANGRWEIMSYVKITNDRYEEKQTDTKADTDRYIIGF